MHAFRQLAASTRATPQRLALPLLANACRVLPPLPQPRASVRGRCLSTDPGKVGPGAVGWLSAKMSKQMSKMGAFNAVKAAADKGDAQAMTLMGVCYAMGRDVAQDDSRAAEWFRRAADKGNPEGALALGNWLLQGRGGLVADQAEAFKHIQFASDKGVLEAHTMLGIMHNEGSGVLRDHKKAAAAFSRAVPADLKAMHNLGVLMIQGKGVKPQQSKGMEYVRRAATGGVAEAQFTVSIWYRDGALGTKQDHKRAYEWAVKAAKQGHSQAQHNVAVQLAEGVGVAQSQRQAADWYNAAVGNGQVESMCNLGLLLLTGLRPSAPACPFVAPLLIHI